MRVLTVFACMAAAALGLSCAPGAPLTVDNALAATRKAVEESDPRALRSLLSSRSLARAGEMSRAMREMDDRQAVALSERLKMDPVRLRSMTVEDYCMMILKEDPERSVLKRALASPVSRVTRGEKRAVVMTESGFDLAFVKEGLYWKLDITDL